MIPRCLRLNRLVPTKFGVSVVSKAERPLFQARILDGKNQIRSLENDAFFAQRRIEFECPDDFASIKLHASFNVMLQSRPFEQSHEKKLASAQQRHANGARAPGKCTVHNLSSYKPNVAKTAVLNLGLTFNTGSETDRGKIICAVKNALSLVELSRRDAARTRAVSVLSSFRHLQPSPLTSAELQVVKSLCNNKDIVIFSADKGNATVWLDTNDYVNKINAFLEDFSTFLPLRSDPTATLRGDLEKLLADVFRFVPPPQKTLYYSLLCNNGRAPAINGLNKIHKTGVPIRPIVHFTRSPLNKLSAYLHRTLSPLVGKSETQSRNSDNFIDKVRDMVLDDNVVLASFDVRSLSTSVPVGLAIDVCKTALKSDQSLSDRTAIDVPDLLRLLKFCLENTYFIFRSKCYKQVHGIAMGSSVSVTVANLTMEGVENQGSHFI
ncbi:hypothetical protein HPB51_027771 [Rhipicephalus microplus]|uniref:Uncharacterized protein n=1 Tax=Rhipicephalus microplus TaxID=6941 RepID=A0A9J6CZ33_RHIMP|nr:hypothetical protein HPB51_027771 [Rhipicephalus microplus]